ncbi:hypothetical protein N826_11180 [Skermanella aerolata KACC 11604]|nr:hypothetical protein N826_11180 [Skermanella aerolata KACC 11604]
MHPLGHVENQIPTVALQQPACKIFEISDPIDLPVVALQRFLDGIDGFRVVEFRRFFGGEAKFKIAITKIVGQSDAHWR